MRVRRIQHDGLGKSFLLSNVPFFDMISIKVTIRRSMERFTYVGKSEECFRVTFEVVENVGQNEVGKFVELGFSRC